MIIPKLRIFVYILTLTGLCMMFLPLSVLAAGSISQGFTTDDKNVTSGSLVSYDTAKQNVVQLANTDHTQQLVGIAGDNALIELSNGAKEVQVVTSGIAQAFVSNINGTVKRGDKITASPLNGIGMKATEEAQVVGTAQLDLKEVRTITRTVTERSGKKDTVTVGLIPVQVIPPILPPSRVNSHLYSPPSYKQLPIIQLGKTFHLYEF